MRIRKSIHQKRIDISNLGFIIGDNSSTPTRVDCPLNQSPWDIVSEPKIGGGDTNTLPKVNLMKFKGNTERDVSPPGNLVKKKLISTGEDSKKEQKKIQGAKKYSKPGPCKKEVVSEDLLCQPRPYNKRGASGSNSDYIYYSGFGPGTSKQRGQKNQTSAPRLEIDIEKYCDLSYISDSSNDDKEKGSVAVSKKRGRKSHSMRCLLERP